MVSRTYRDWYTLAQVYADPLWDDAIETCSAADHAQRSGSTTLEWDDLWQVEFATSSLPRLPLNEARAASRRTCG
jgi:hypothetical protein